MPIALYIATVIGAAAVWLMMPKSLVRLQGLGALVGAAALGGLWLYAARTLPADSGLPPGAFAYYYVFSAISIAAAVRVITHTRPVYAALWFVMVVLSSAGLFLILSAEFMAFAMVIIYGGAILVTYMFVIMLASQSQPDGDSASSPAYDRLAREPLAAVTAGFLLMAVLLNVVFDATALAPNPAARAPSDAELAATVLTRRAPDELASVPVAEQGLLSNVQRVGLDLFTSHPLAIELAGVVLLVSLIGAVVIAKTRVPGEDAVGRAAPDASGASVSPAYEPGPADPQTAGSLRSS